ncbi:unnamed protein product [Cylicostephanus goldi]|uniref:Uncharacterized protein n=1 Tax=Cylicostephanus goldi TaxID=71465 RepID=A0A3P7N1W5_CYLGO|nr:unnamed protein product [Cylicostephanus goldi]
MYFNKLSIQCKFFPQIFNFPFAARQLHYPSVCVQVPRAPASQVSTPPSGVSYAIPYPKPIQYSATQLHYENMKHRCKMLDSENQRLMRVQNELIMDANRRVEVGDLIYRLLQIALKIICASMF